MKKKLALGHQEFSEIINNNCIYVDKTQDIYKLINSGSYYFLSRPRRFGKSLLMNTIKELFKANKELFKGLWIYDKWDWEEQYPVIKISFSSIGHNKLGLEEAIDNELNNIANEYGVALTQKANATKFAELIRKVSVNQKVVILIDEYDKPIIDYMNNIPQAEKNRDTLKELYSIIKDADSYIRFFMVTGVSKFSHVSIFSDLNHLTDLTIDRKFPAITGFTRQELEGNFGDYIDEARQMFSHIPDIFTEIKSWYNGYSWDGKTRVYNPVSIMNFFRKQQFDNYWFSTGTPTMLMKIIKEQQLTAFDLEHTYTTNKILDKYDFTNIDLISLLFQTGYLTIENMSRSGRIKLAYPNKEVEQSFSSNIFAELSNNQEGLAQNLLFKIADSFTDNTIEKFIEYINELFKNIPYSIVERSEKYFHSLFYLVIKLIGYEIDTEVLTIDGRIDAVVTTDDNIFIIEFKINQSAEKAIKQIVDKKYAEKYQIEGKPISLLGINFDTETKKIDDYLLKTR